MSTHNICFHGEIRKISAFSDEKSSSSVAMLSTHQVLYFSLSPVTQDLVNRII